jgi:chemotaxis protein CheC
MIQLSDIEQDALGESFNLALGQAAAVFADLVNEEIQLSVPTVEILEREALVKRLEELTGTKAAQDLCCIAQHYVAGKAFDTDTLLLFPEHGSLEIVRRMLGRTEIHLDQITELEQDALGEIGNIIINSCMSGLANILGTEVIGTLPGVQTIKPANLLDDHPKNEVILVAKIGMTMLTHDVTGYVLFIMDVPSLTAFMSSVRSFFGISD